MDLETLTLDELRDQWSLAWQQKTPDRLGRKMLETSLAYKIREAETGGLSQNAKNHLENLFRSFRQNHKCFDERKSVLKPGTKLLRIYKGKQYSVTVTEIGFEYNDKVWSSLSKIANHITGSKWNGWVFFGLK